MNKFHAEDVVYGEDKYMQDMKEHHVVYIDILKAIACICVLVGHVVGGIMKANIDISEILIHIHTYVYLFHVPCFFFASGYLYGNKQIKGWREYASFVMKKLIVLGVPYLVCTILYVIMSSLLSNEMNPNTSYSFDTLLNIWRVPIAYFWYLYVLIILFVVIPAVEIIFKPANKTCLWVIFALLTLWKSDILWINYITQYSYLFYLGVIWNISNNNRWRSYLQQHTHSIWGGIYCVESVMLYLIYTIFQKENLLSGELRIIFESIITLLLVITMVRISFVIAETGKYIKSFLLWVSKYSLYIYLFHIWFSGTIRIILRRMGIVNGWVQTFIGVAVGLIGPILLSKFIKKVPVLLFWIEPWTVLKRYYKKGGVKDK